MSRSPVPTTAPSVWTPADFPDESAWSFDFSPDDRHALIDYARDGDSADLASHFEAMTPHWAALLNSGPGFVRLRHFPTDALSGVQIKRGYLGLGHELLRSGVPKQV